jgi:hypothetical protein
MCNLHGRVHRRELASSIQVPQESCHAQILLFNFHRAEESIKEYAQMSVLPGKDKNFELKMIENIS